MEGKRTTITEMMLGESRVMCRCGLLPAFFVFLSLHLLSFCLNFLLFGWNFKWLKLNNENHIIIMIMIINNWSIIFIIDFLCLCTFFRWRSSLWKLLWRELLVYTLVGRLFMLIFISISIFIFIVILLILPIIFIESC